MAIHRGDWNVASVSEPSVFPVSSAFPTTVLTLSVM